MYLIIFTGAPASGKSTIASFFAKEMAVPFLSKDEIKVSLFEKYGFNSNEERTKLSIQAEEMLYQDIATYINKNENIIVDNFFENFDRIKSIVENKTNCIIICFNLISDNRKLADRYNKRISNGNRHISLYTIDVYPVINGKSTFHKKATKQDFDKVMKRVTENTYGNYVYDINTNDIEDNFDEIVCRLRENIELSMEMDNCDRTGLSR